MDYSDDIPSRSRDEDELARGYEKLKARIVDLESQLAAAWGTARESDKARMKAECTRNEALVERDMARGQAEKRGDSVVERELRSRLGGLETNYRDLQLDYYALRRERSWLLAIIQELREALVPCRNFLAMHVRTMKPSGDEFGMWDCHHGGTEGVRQYQLDAIKRADAILDRTKEGK